MTNIVYYSYDCLSTKKEVIIKRLPQLTNERNNKENENPYYSFIL